MRRNGLITVLLMVAAVIVLVICMIFLAPVDDVRALSRQSAENPGESLSSQYSTTTPVLMYGVFAVEVTSTGVGTIYIQRSEDGTTYKRVKTLTNASPTEQRKYLYETFGDTDKSKGAWYRAWVQTLSSGSYVVRFVK